MFAAAELLLLCGASLAQVAVSSAPPPIEIRVVWPPPGLRYPPLERSFSFGSVTPGSILLVNGRPVPVEPSGAFLTMVELVPGQAALSYEAFLAGASTAVIRQILVDSPPASVSEIDLATVEPAADLELGPGDALSVRMRGPAGLSGRFSIGKRAKDLPLVERPGALGGLYEGHWIVPPGERAEKLELKLELKGPGAKHRAVARARISLGDGTLARVALTSAPVTVLKAGPGGGYWHFLPPGVKLRVAGTQGAAARVRLTPGFEGWVELSRLKLLPEGTPPPRAIVGRDLVVESSTRAVRVAIPVSEPVPFEITHEIAPMRVRLRFFGAEQRIDRVNYAPGGSVLGELRWSQQDSDTVEITVPTALDWGWGYDGSYDGKGRFMLEIRRPPELSASGSVLKGRRIAVDPGHGPDTGAVGPLGSTERDVNMELGFALEERLRREGAEPFLIRTSSNGPPLADRPALAWSRGAELFVSLHNNALPLGDDPLGKPRGFMNLYYHPQSRPLVEAVHERYRKNFPGLADNGIVWGDLHVCRTTWMPSILTESAYLIVPGQEQLLLSPGGRKHIAETIAQGLIDYLEVERKRQLAGRKSEPKKLVGRER